MEKKQKNKKKSTDKNYVKKTIKFLPKDYEKVKELMKESNLDFSNLVKTLVLKSTVISIEKPNIINEHTYKFINSISNNINQLTKAIHTNNINKKNEELILNSLYNLGQMERDINLIKNLIVTKNNDN